VAYWAVPVLILHVVMRDESISFTMAHHSRLTAIALIS